MGKVEFHHGTSDKIAYACRLLRKAYRSGSQVVVTADDATLKTLDKQLWVFDEFEFVPHVHAAAGKVVPQRMWSTPIWLTGDPASAPGERQILINLGVKYRPTWTDMNGCSRSSLYKPTTVSKDAVAGSSMKRWVGRSSRMR